MSKVTKVPPLLNCSNFLCKVLTDVWQVVAMERYTFSRPPEANGVPIPVPPPMPIPKSAGSGKSAGKLDKKRPSSSKWKRKDFNYQTYNASHPALLDEVTDIVTRGLAAIDKKRHGGRVSTASTLPKSQFTSGPEISDSDENQLEKLGVYRSAFQHYLANSNIYKPFLTAFLQESDNTLYGLQDKIRESATFRSELATLQESYDRKFEGLEEKHNAEMKAQINRVKAMEKDLTASQRKFAEAEEKASKAINDKAKMAKEWEEMRTSIGTITNSLVRYEESNKSLKQQDAHQQAAFVKLKVSEQKGNTEAEKLRARVQELEQEHDLLVSHKEIEEKVEEIEHLRLLLKNSEKENNDLIQRYSVLKAALGTSFKKQVTRTQISSAAINTFTSQLSGTDEHLHSKRGQAENTDAASSSPTYSSIEAGQNDAVGVVAVYPTVDTLLENPEKVIAFMDAMGTDFRSLVEALLNYITELKSMVTFKVSLHSEAESSEGKSVGAILEAQEKAAKKKEMAADGMVTSVTDRVQTEWAHFDGLGEDEIVPPFLRITGKVQNLFFTRKDVGAFINLVMNDARKRLMGKIGPDGTRAPVSDDSHLNFSTHFHQYMIDRFRHQFKVAEVSYNLIEGCRKFRQESDCRLFLAILDGVLSEESWYDMVDTSQGLLEVMLSKEAKSVNVVEGKRRLTMEEFMRTIRSMYPQKNSNALSRIVRALQLENKSHRFVLHLRGLLSEHRDGTRSMLLELLRSQYISETIEYQEYVVECMNGLRKNTKETSTVIGRLRMGLEKADPEKSRHDVNILLARGAGVRLEEVLLMEVKRSPVEYDSFIRKLKRGLLKKSVIGDAVK